MFELYGESMISDKSDQKSVDQILAMGYPENIGYLDKLLAWTCDPNWPVAASIYQYFLQLGQCEVPRVLQLASTVDEDWRYVIITNIIAFYDKHSLELCAEKLTFWARQTGSGECDFESLRILSDNNLIADELISKIARRNLFVYNLWIKETFEAAGASIYKFPLQDHTL